MKIVLDRSKLLGYRLLSTEEAAASGRNHATLSCKLGVKAGLKLS
jgi:hypothetical protein